MPSEYVSTADQQSGVVGRTSLPPTILPDQNSPVAAATQQQIAAPQRTSSTEELLNLATQKKLEIQQQHLGIANQRSQLANQMSGLKMGSHGRPTPQSRAIEMQMHGLDRQERDLENQDKFVDFQTSHRISSAMKDASSAEKFATETLAHQTAQQAGEVFLRGTEIMNKYAPGTPEFQDEMTKLRERLPLGFNSQAVRGHFGPIAKFHENEVNRQGQKLQSITGLTPEEFAAIDPSKVQSGVIVDDKGKLHVGGSGFDTSGKAKGGFTNKAEVAGLIPDQYKGKKWEDIPADVRKTINQTITGGGAIQMDTGKGYSVVIPRPQYENFKRLFAREPTAKVAGSATTDADAYAQSQGFMDSAQLEQFRTTGKVVQPTGQVAVADEGRAAQGFPTLQPAQVDPRVDLAKRALADPNASPAHKAAAKRVLGLQ